MQSADPHKSEHTDEDNFDLSKGPPSLPADITVSQTSAEEGTHSEPETRAKIKTKSRFATAFRRLSKSSKKKQREEAPLESAPTESVISSAGEEATEQSNQPTLPEPKPKKKDKLTKRFSLSGLKKTKISPKKSTEKVVEAGGAAFPSVLEDSVPVEKKSPIDAQENIHVVLDSTGCPRLEHIRKVQITISGKKVEEVAVSRKKLSVTTTEIVGSSGESDYLVPTTTDSPQVSTAVKASKLPSKDNSASPNSTPFKLTRSDSAKAKNKKLKSNKVSAKATTASTKATAKKTTTLTSNQSFPAAQTASTKQNFVITESTLDTPPREQAPAKPSRVTAVAVSSSSHTANSIQAECEQTALKGKALTSSTHVDIHHLSCVKDTPSTTSNKLQRTSTAPTKSELKTNLMLSAPSTQQRGHRFPRPKASTTIVSCSGNTTPSSTNPTLGPLKVATAATTSTSSPQQRQIQFQLESHASSCPILPSTPPSQHEKESQSQKSNELLRTSVYPRPPIPPDSLYISTPETRSSTHRHPSTHTKIAFPSSAVLDNIASTSITTATSCATDETVSSAESAQPSEYFLNSIQTQDSLTVAPTVRFAVGSPVRPQAISIVPRLHEQSNFLASDSDSDTQSPASESLRKRIHYVAQLSQNDEQLDSFDRARETGVSEYSEYSLDSENDSIDNQMPAFGDLTMDQEMEPTIVTSSSTEKREHLYKILVIGELGTGKTSFIKRYVHQFFSQNYRATIGVDFALKVLHWDANTIVRLQLWDIAGQERFGNMTRVYYKEAVGAFIVFDVTRSGTFECVSKWKEDLDSKVQLADGNPIPCILLANKCDQEKQGIVTTPEKLDEYVRDNGFIAWYETSAKENINIDEAARALVNKILLNDKMITAADIADSEKLNLNNATEQTDADAKSKCSC